MNFLAHLYLSGSNQGVMVGNFIGDFVKGRRLEERFEKDVQVGIELHRHIDFFTDSHDIVSQSKKRLWPKYRHYAGVIVDIYYDHFLAKQWDAHHPELLPDYADRCYTVLQSNLSRLPEEVQFMLPYMIKGNWLVNYARLEGIHRALSGMARRTTFVSKMDEAVEDIKKDYDKFNEEFNEFFPALKNQAVSFLSQYPLTK
jgi:acyl carrier protein phosphodiesterase